jgi:hypothetical protein
MLETFRYRLYDVITFLLQKSNIVKLFMLPLILISVLFDRVWDGNVGVQSIEELRGKFSIILSMFNPNLVISNNAFDSNFYLSDYKDVRDLKVNPFLHFHTRGRFEGRVPSLKIKLLNLEFKFSNIEVDKVFHLWINDQRKFK